MSWSEVGKEGDPVRGNVAEFDSATSQWRTAKGRATDIQAEFALTIDGGYVGLEGKAADAFKSIVVETKRVLDDIPQVFGSMETVLRDHLTKLKEYRAAADTALANAKVAKETRRVAAAASAAANTRMASLKRQILQLEAQPPEQSDGQVVSLKRQLSSEASLQRQKASEASVAQTTLSNEIAKWDSLRAQEDELNRQTANKLDHFDLMSLRDPGWLDKVGNYFTEFADDVIGFISSALSGDWEQAMWHLRGVLDKVLEVLGVVLIIVAILGTVLTLGALAPLLITTLLVLSSLKLLITVALVASDSTNKVTGEKLGIVDVIFDSLDVASNAVSFGGAKAIFWGGGSRARGIAAREGMLIMKNNGFNISVKRTLSEVGKEVVKERIVGLTKNAVSNHNEQNPEGSAFFGTADDRSTVIMSEISMMRSGNLGLSQPIQTVVICPAF